MTYLDALSTKACDENERVVRFILAHAVLLSFPGVPAIYIQSILGSRNDYDGVTRLGYNRAINRKKYFSEEIEQELADNKTLRHKIYHALSELIAVRRAEKAFHPNSEAIFEMSGEQVLKIIRIAENGERVTALFNFSSQYQNIKSAIQTGKELITGNDINGTTLTLNPWQVMWIKEN